MKKLAEFRLFSHKNSITIPEISYYTALQITSKKRNSPQYSITWLLEVHKSVREDKQQALPDKGRQRKGVATIYISLVSIYCQ